MAELMNWTVIVVEDTFDDVELASAILKHHGATVKIANNGKECLALLEQFTPTLIITDLAMPEMDGWEMLTQIRDDVDYQNIPVVAVTAYGSFDVEHDVAVAGFDAYFSKPLRPRTLIEDLKSIVG